MHALLKLRKYNCADSDVVVISEPEKTPDNDQIADFQCRIFCRTWSLLVLPLSVILQSTNWQSSALFQDWLSPLLQSSAFLKDGSASWQSSAFLKDGSASWQSSAFLKDGSASWQSFALFQHWLSPLLQSSAFLKDGSASWQSSALFQNWLSPLLQSSAFLKDGSASWQSSAFLKDGSATWQSSVFLKDGSATWQSSALKIVPTKKRSSKLGVFSYETIYSWPRQDSNLQPSEP